MDPQPPGPGTALCRFDEIPDGEGREFVFGTGMGAWRGFVVRRGGDVFGYVNECPHHFVPLNDREDRFVTWDHQWIICSAHAAVFRYDDGHCEDGPCKGRGLIPWAVVVRDGAIVTA
jgi:nitrite reductase/ring-hydroxylating ferredoxin subunit